jgi:hypothetical protein
VRDRFDALAASHGAASVGLIALFTISGAVVLVEPDESGILIGCALLFVAVLYLVAMTVIGRLARSGGLLEHRFDFRAGSHGAAGFCIAGIFACSGIFTLAHLWGDRAALGISLLTISGGCAVGMASWGLACRAPAVEKKDSRLSD